MSAMSLIVTGALLLSAAAGAGSQPEYPAGRAAAAMNLSARLSLNKKVYGSKDPVKMTFTVKAAGKSPVKIMFGSGQKYDFEIRKGKTSTGEKVWQWGRGRMFIEMVTFATLEPGKELTFAETFVPVEKGADGRPVPELQPGVYTATAILQTSGRAPRPMASVTFSVK